MPGKILHPFLLAAAAWLLSLLPITLKGEDKPDLLNASYDISRELYRDLNTAFAATYKTKTGKLVDIRQSHAGSARQVLAILEGTLDPDVVTFNMALDINTIARTGLLPTNWREAFPNRSSPWTSITSFLVRKGNPKAIHDWDDLARDGVTVSIANPKTGGNGRYAYLAAYAFAREKFKGDETQARNLLRKLYANCPVPDSSGRGATTAFVQRGAGDVLVTFEVEAELIRRAMGDDKVERVTPSLSIESDFPVALLKQIASRHNSTELARAYLTFLFSPEAQEIGARHFYRVCNPQIAAAHQGQFVIPKLVNVKKDFGGWDSILKIHFSEGGIFDQITR